MRLLAVCLLLASGAAYSAKKPSVKIDETFDKVLGFVGSVEYTPETLKESEAAHSGAKLPERVA